MLPIVIITTDDQNARVAELIHLRRPGALRARVSVRIAFKEYEYPSSTVPDVDNFVSTLQSLNQTKEFLISGIFVSSECRYHYSLRQIWYDFDFRIWKFYFFISQLFKYCLMHTHSFSPTPQTFNSSWVLTFSPLCRLIHHYLCQIDEYEGFHGKNQ